VCRALVARAAVAFVVYATLADAGLAQNAPAKALSDNRDRYEARFGKRSIDELIVDDHGKGPATLQGLRNLRVVLPGILYRAGGNNVYRKPPLANMGPLPPEALSNLCAQGFVAAVYLYNSGYQKAAVSCDYNGQTHEFSYLQVLIDHSKAKETDFLRLVRGQIVSNNPQPILVHCFNGYHDSGYASAIALRQFCGFDAERAYRYWERNAAPGVSFAAMKSRIARFQQLPELGIEPVQQAAICPRLTP